jgi:hypothetical protein
MHMHMSRLVDALVTAARAVLYARLDTGWGWPTVPCNGDIRDRTANGIDFHNAFL